MMPRFPGCPGRAGALLRLGHDQSETHSAPMLQIIRSTVGTWVVKILFVALIISFAVWGVGDISQGVNNGVATVGDAKISPAELDKAYRAEINRMRQMIGPEFTEEQARQFGLRDRALEQLIQRELLAQAADDLGIRIADDTVRKEVTKVPAFKDSFGNFDANLMRALLLQNGMNEQGFVEDVRADMARGDVAAAISSGASVPSLLARDLFRFRFEQRGFDAVTIPYTAMPEAKLPEQSVLEAFHQEKAVRYTAPEYRTLNVAILEAAPLAKDVEVTDEGLREYYDAHSNEYITPERRSLIQAVFTDKAAGEKALADIAAGKSVDDVAKAAGLESVTLDDVLKTDLPAELADPAFAAAANTPVGPVESAFGFHVLTVTAIKAGGERTFEQVKDEVTAKVRAEKSIDKMFEVSTKLEDELAGGTPLAEAAQTVGARLVTLTKVDARGTNAAGVAQGAGLPSLDKILTTGFSLPAGQTGSVEEAGAEAFFAVQVESVDAAALKPFDQVKALVIGDWQAEQKQAAAKQKASEVAEKMRAGATAKDASAGITGALAQKIDPVFRAAGPNAIIPADALQTLFAGTLNDVAVGDKPTGQVVVKLTQIIPANPDTAQAAAQIASLSNSLQESASDDLTLQYLAGLRAHYGVTLNRNLLNTLYPTQE